MVQVLGRELIKQGHKVYVVGLYPHGYGQADYEDDQGVKVWRLRYRTDIGLIKNTYSITDILFLKILKYTSLLHWDSKLSTKSLFDLIRKLIDEYSIEVIEIPDWNTFLQNSFAKTEIPVFKIPLVVKLHGSYSYLANEMTRPFNRRVFLSEKALLNRADALSSVSLYTACETKKLFDITKQISILHNSINVEPGIVSDRFEDKVIFSGALVKTKGIHSLLKAWNIIHREFPAVTLHLFGKGPVKQIKKMIEKDVLASVQFHGHISREILLKELSTAAIAIFPSYSECFSIAPLEAMAAGCAVIYTSRSSGPELISDRENGLLIDPDDINSIVNAVELLITNKDIRIKIAEMGRKLVSEKFNVIYAAQQHTEFYSRVIDEFRNKRQ